jgi:hypothetical protein
MKATSWSVVIAAAAGCVEGAEPNMSSVEQATSNPVVARSVFNGGGASVGSWDPETERSFWIAVHENGVGKARTATLSFSFHGPDLTSQECHPWWDPEWGPTPCWYTRWSSIWGMGEIPQADFSVSPKAESARLLTTTGPAFFVETCSSEGCTAGGTYAFDLVFTGNGFMHSEHSGSSTFSMGMPDWDGNVLAFRTSGTFRSQGAYADGTALGLTIANELGRIERTSGAMVTRDLVRVTR